MLRSSVRLCCVPAQFSMPQHADSALLEGPINAQGSVLVGTTALEIAPGLEPYKHATAGLPKPPASVQTPPLSVREGSEEQPLLPVYHRKRSQLYWVRKVGLLLAIFSASLSLVVILFLHLPTIDTIEEDSEQTTLKVPTTLEELKVFRNVIDRYQVRVSYAYLSPNYVSTGRSDSCRSSNDHHWIWRVVMLFRTVQSIRNVCPCGFSKFFLVAVAEGLWVHSNKIRCPENLRD